MCEESENSLEKISSLDADMDMQQALRGRRLMRHRGQGEMKEVSQLFFKSCIYKLFGLK